MWISRATTESVQLSKMEDSKQHQWTTHPIVFSPGRQIASCWIATPELLVRHMIPWVIRQDCIPAAACWCTEYQRHNRKMWNDCYATADHKSSQWAFVGDCFVFAKKMYPPFQFHVSHSLTEQYNILRRILLGGFTWQIGHDDKWTANLFIIEIRNSMEIQEYLTQWRRRRVNHNEYYSASTLSLSLVSDFIYESSESGCRQQWVN